MSLLPASRGSDLGSSFFLRTYGEYVPIAGVPRRLRLQYPGAIYHLMARGNGRQNIVRDDVDRDRLQEHLGKAALRRGWRVYAFAVMPNDLHIVLKTPQPNVARGMQAFLRRVVPLSNGSGRWCAANPAVSGAGNSDFLPPNTGIAQHAPLNGL
jgi:Transposase IS200 like